MTPDWVKDAVVGTGVLTVETGLWRVRADGGIWVASDDDGQQFGLLKPIDAAERAASRLRGLAADIEVAAETSDLITRFEDGVTLEVLNTSCGYESWSLRSVKADMQMIGVGGEGVAFARLDGTSAQWRSVFSSWEGL